MYRLKDVVLFVIFHSKFLASFILLEVFLIVSYFSNSLFKREGVWKLIQLSIGYLKWANLNEKKKVPLKEVSLGGGGGYKKIFAGVWFYF